MKKTIVFVVVLTVLLVLCACGGEKKAEENPPAQVMKEASATPAEELGTKLAQEILSVFDEIVAKVATLSAKQGSADELKGQLENLVSEYRGKMEEYNAKYLGLKADVVSWGACNRYLGEKRGAHVFKKDSELSAAINFYSQQPESEEIVRLISKTAIELLDIAVNQALPQPEGIQKEE